MAKGDWRGVGPFASSRLGAKKRMPSGWRNSPCRSGFRMRRDSVLAPESLLGAERGMPAVLGFEN
jgi:hypothetical protein